jgi:Cu/Ag efflux protein CusF
LIRFAPKSVLVFVGALTFGFATPSAQSQQTNLPPPSERYPFASGRVERLDLGSQRISLKTSIGARTFEVTARTYIFRGKEKITLDKLRIGDELKLSYRTNELGQALVERIKADQTGPDTDAAGPRPTTR